MAKRVQAFQIEKIIEQAWLKRRGQWCAAWPIEYLEWLFSRLQFKQKSRPEVIRKHKDWLESAINARRSLDPACKNAVCFRGEVQQLLLDVGCLAQLGIPRPSAQQPDVELQPGIKKRIRWSSLGRFRVYAEFE